MIPGGGAKLMSSSTMQPASIVNTMVNCGTPVNNRENNYNISGRPAGNGNGGFGAA